MASKLTNEQRGLLKLVMRSADIGDGWRQCSDMIYRTLIPHSDPALIERDDTAKRVRMTPEGQTVFKWL